mgnify:CR=1 FL=1
MKRQIRSSVVLRNIREVINGGKAKATRIENSQLYRVKDEEKEIVISRLGRLGLYRQGIGRRIDRLVESYCLNGIVRKGDIFIDVGANIGELGVWVTSLDGMYVGIEPEEKEFEALQRNVPDGALYNVGAWHTNSILKFYSKGETADSSIIPIERFDRVSEISVRTIDDIVDAQSIREIRVLKVETEGAEPEVLQGARETLNMCEFVALDCGEERGVENASTFLACHQILSESGFSPFRDNLRQYRLLYKNTWIQPRSATP